MQAVMSVQSEAPAGGALLAGPVSADVGPVVLGPVVLGPADGLQLTRVPPRPEASQKLAKRRYSMGVGFRHPGLSKRRRRANSESDPVLPSNFLLGGNIFDPLNLNSLLDEEVSRALNAETPRSSPLPSRSREPVEILIPKDMRDPLNLSGAGDALLSPVKSRRRHRTRSHHSGAAEGPDTERSKVSEGSSVCADPAEAADAAVLPPVPESPRPYELNTSINCRDEVVPLILPRRRSHPSSSSSAPPPPRRSASSGPASKHRKRRRTCSRSDRLAISPTPPTRLPPANQSFHTPRVGGASGAPALRVGNAQQQRRPRRGFHYGSYSRYYGYRTPSLTSDPRLSALRPEWFRGRSVLDLGCNTGHVALAIAAHWGPARVLGLDVDGALVHAARHNLRNFLSERGQEPEVAGQGSEVVGPAPRWFPVSFTRCRGPVAAPPVAPHTPGLFPHNLSFMQADYVPDSDGAVASQSAEFDVILCLSLTKWVHLNHGDAGLQRLFQRIYRHLTPGGALILEPQPWSSYSRHKRLTEATYRNYSSIRLKPDQFSSFLTADVGFSSYELIGTHRTGPAGVPRSIYLFHKGPASSRK